MIENRLIENSMLFIIPSWGALLGYPLMGKYQNQAIPKIIEDPIIFIGGLESTLNTHEGTLHYLFGLGNYSVKFKLQSGGTMTDERSITGLILADFVYDYLAANAGSILKQDKDVIISDRIIKVPINLSGKSETQKMFIKGAIMRNILMPHKKIIIDMMERINGGFTYQIEKQGHILLSTIPNQFNRFFYSNKMAKQEMYRFTQNIPGIDGFVSLADEHLRNMFIPKECEIIEQNIIKNRKIFSTLEYDKNYLYSIFENAAPKLVSKFIDSKEYEDLEDIAKEFLFYTAHHRLDSIRNWPKRFKRRTQSEMEIQEKQIKSEAEPKYDIMSKIRASVQKNSSTENGFQLRTKATKFVAKRPLPEIPTTSIQIILSTLKKIILDDYEMTAVGLAFREARDHIRGIKLHTDYMSDLDWYANLYSHREQNRAMNPKEKQLLLEKVDSWMHQ